MAAEFFANERSVRRIEDAFESDKSIRFDQFTVVNGVYVSNVYTDVTNVTSDVASWDSRHIFFNGWLPMMKGLVKSRNKHV